MLSDKAHDATFAAMSKLTTSSTARKVTLLAVLAVLLSVAADPVAAQECMDKSQPVCKS